MSEKLENVTLDEALEEVKKSEEEELKEEAKAQDEQEMAQAIFDPNAPIVTIKKLLEAGSHYGHQTRRWNPKMGKYIYCARNGIYIIDLNKSKEAIENAYQKLKEIVTEGGKVLLVGTKQIAKDIIKEEAERSGSLFITNRWLGGTLTNFKTIQLRIKKLKELEQDEADGVWDRLPKKEVALLKKEKDRLAKNLDGIKEMRKVPNAIVVVAPDEEKIAVKEANKLGIPVFAIVDTNCDPDNIAYPIPANDDSDKSIKLILGLLCDAIVEAKGGLPEVAYTKDEGEEATMKDALRQADRENALRIAARREMQRERLEKEKARYQARFNRSEKPVEAKEETKTVETEVVATSEAEVKEEAPKAKKTSKKATKKEEVKTEEEVKVEE